VHAFRLFIFVIRLLVGLHHVAVDGVSLGILLSDLSALYHGNILPSLPIQYLDYSTEEAKSLAANEFKDSAAFWAEYLHDCVPVRETVKPHMELHPLF
jgi:surfactin family lipopeptide synthetase A